MSSQLYKAAASVEMAGVISYSIAFLTAVFLSVIHWGDRWFPLCVMIGIVACRLACSHLKERNRLIADAKELEQEPNEYE